MRMQPTIAHDFYPRPPRGGRPGVKLPDNIPMAISIHALREEGDDKLTIEDAVLTVFLSTPSARRATFTTMTII